MRPKEPQKSPACLPGRLLRGDGSGQLLLLSWAPNQKAQLPSIPIRVVIYHLGQVYVLLVSAVTGAGNPAGGDPAVSLSSRLLGLYLCLWLPAPYLSGMVS